MPPHSPADPHGNNSKPVGHLDTTGKGTVKDPAAVNEVGGSHGTSADRRGANGAREVKKSTSMGATKERSKGPLPLTTSNAKASKVVSGDTPVTLEQETSANSKSGGRKHGLPTAKVREDTKTGGKKLAAPSPILNQGRNSSASNYVNTGTSSTTKTDRGRGSSAATYINTSTSSKDPAAKSKPAAPPKSGKFTAAATEMNQVCS